MAMSKSGVELLNEFIDELSFSIAQKGGGDPKSSGAAKVQDPPAAPMAAAKAVTAPAAQAAAAKAVTAPAAQAAAPPAAPPAAAKAALTINALDLRVGRIVEVKRHDTADKLYCEMIDVGEDAPRPIASGLVPHYTLEQMAGRRLIVVANLKPRNLVGFKSFGMVLCAAKTDPSTGKETVEFVDPPIDAPIGSRVVADCDGGVSDPLSAAQVEKQKAFEQLAADLRVGEDGVAQWRGNALKVGEAKCTAPTLRDALIR